MSNRFWLTEAQMARLEPFFPKSHGRPRVGDPRVLSGMIFFNRNGLRRCDALREYGPHTRLGYDYFSLLKTSPGRPSVHARPGPNA